MTNEQYLSAYRDAVGDVMTVVSALLDQREAELNEAVRTNEGVTEARAKFDACADVFINLPRFASARSSL